MLLGVLWLSGCVHAPVADPETLSGTVECREVKVASKVPGRVTQLREQGIAVRKNELLAALSSRELEDGVRSARAALSVARQRLQAAETALELQSRVNDSAEQGARAAVGTAEAQAQAARRAYAYQVGTRRAQENQAEAALRAAESSLQPLALEQEQARRDYERLSKLYKAGYLPAQKVDAARTAWAVAQGEYATAQAQVAQARAARDTARAQAGLDQVRLAQSDVASSGITVAESQVRAAQAQRVQEALRREEALQARAGVDQARAALDVAQTAVNDTRIYAPTDGTIMRRAVEVGELVNEGQPLLSIADLHDLWVTVYLPAPLRNRVQPGTVLPVVVDTNPPRHVHGTVFYVATTAEFTPKNIQTQEERVTETYQVKVRLPASDGLYPGMTADVQVPMSQGPAPIPENHSGR